MSSETTASFSSDASLSSLDIGLALTLWLDDFGRHVLLK